jgi:hypothetical protein
MALTKSMRSNHTQVMRPAYATRPHDPARWIDLSSQKQENSCYSLEVIKTIVTRTRGFQKPNQVILRLDFEK